MEASLNCFSAFPFELLLTIVSLLPFKEAVRTSVLSKQWLNVCKFMPNLEFNELFFVEPGQHVETREAQRRAFLEFVKSWIENHKGTVLNKFSLRLSMPEKVTEVIDGWIAFATQRGVKELELDFAHLNRNENSVYFDDYEAQFELPAQFYKHNYSLQSLKLYSCSFLETEMFNFRALKEISLGWMEVRLTAIKALLWNCARLETCCFKKCWSSNDFNLGKEEHAGLRKLVLDKCRFEFAHFKVNAPNLKVFTYCGLMNFLTIEINSPLMEEAELDFSLEYGFEGHGQLIYNLVEGVSTARVLTVCSFVLQVIPSGSEHLRMQRDMLVRHLIMKTALHQNEFIGIAFFLKSCPMLECLTIQLCSQKDLFDYEAPFEINNMQFWTDNVGIHECSISSLEVVEIKGFRGTENEIFVLKHFINSGVVLKKISINMLKDGFGRTVKSHCREKAEFLLTVPRASRNLEISIY